MSVLTRRVISQEEFLEAASNARSNAAAETQRQLEAQKAQLQKKLAGYATGDPRVQDLQAEISQDRKTSSLL